MVWKTISQLLAAGGRARQAAAMAADACALVACWHLGYLFRMGWERWQPARPWYDDHVMAVIVMLHLAGLALAGVYRMPWRFFGFVDMARILGVALPVGWACAALVSATALDAVARSVLVLHPVFAVLALCASRMAARVVWEHAQRRLAALQPGRLRRAVVAGAGDQAQRLVETLVTAGGWRVLALFDDAPALRGRTVAGVPVRGPLLAMPEAAECRQADYVIVAVPAGSAAAHARAMDLAYRTGKTVLPMDTIASAGAHPLSARSPSHLD